MADDLATARVLAFAKMEYGRRDGEFSLAADARESLESLGIRVRYTRTRWPKQSRCVRQGAKHDT